VEIIVSDLSEKLDVQTPEQLSLEFSLAGLGSRALALLYDSLIQLIVAVLVALAIGYYGRSMQLYWFKASNWMTAAVIFFFFCMYWGYFALFEILWNGQTPGKRHAQIRVISASGRPITAFEGVARNFLRAVDSTFFYGVAAICAALDKQNRRLGDMVAGTVVIHDNRNIAEPMWYADESRAAQQIGDVAAAITAMEFELVETFLARRLDLPPEVRQKQAEVIAQRIADKMKVARDNKASSEDFLEDVARSYRDGTRYRQSI
jgi:uncharacterized RDD family membrane protein YckC